MERKRCLSQKQLDVLDDLFNSELDEQGVLDKHRVRRSTYEKWVTDELFAERFERYADSARRRGELLLARYSYLAAAKLVELTAKGRGETVRRACLNIICQSKVSAEREKARKGGASVEAEGGGEEEELSPETASRLLAALAEEKEEIAAKKNL